MLRGKVASCLSVFRGIMSHTLCTVQLVWSDNHIEDALTKWSNYNACNHKACVTVILIAKLVILYVILIARLVIL